MQDVKHFRRARIMSSVAPVALTAAALISSPALAQAPAPSQVGIEEGQIEQIVITGSRIPRADLVATSPVAVIGSEEFELSGTVNVEQLLNTLPQVVPGLTNTSNNPGDGTATVDLRGLGAQRTLVLVNGRRWIPSDGADTVTVDVNTIPASLIKRTEVVTGGASAVYGSDAIAGVVNFILKDDFEGIQLDSQYGITEEGDSETWNLNLTIGSNTADGKGNVTLFADYYIQDPTFQRERDFSFFACDDGPELPNTRDGFACGLADPDGEAPQGLIRGGSTSIPGTRLRGAIDIDGDGAIDGSSGVRFEPDGTPRLFNSDTDSFNYAPFNFLQVPLERWEIATTGRYEVVPQYLEAFAEGAFANTRSDQELAPTPAVLGTGSGTPVNVIRITVDDNPFLTDDAKQVLLDSFGDPNDDGIIETTNLLQRRLLEVGSRRSLDTRNAWRVLGGLRGQLDNGWNYETYYSFARMERVNRLENDASATRFAQALLAVTDPGTGEPVCLDPSNGCAPLNIFGEGNISEAAADFIRVSATNITTTQQQVANVSLTGTAIDLPAGPLGFAVGGEWRSENFAFSPDTFLASGDVLGFNAGAPTVGEFQVWELFGEVNVPLVSGVPFIDYLGIDAGFRYSDYDIDQVGGVWTYKATGEWSPIEDLRVRGGFQRAIRAPNIVELFQGTSQDFPPYVDPCSADQNPIENGLAQACINDGVPADLLGIFTQGNSQVQASIGGNPDLEEETADTFTIGAVWQPRFVPGLSLTVDYFNIEVEDAIAPFGGGAPFVIAGCILSGNGLDSDAFCAAYQRDPFGDPLIVQAPNENIATLKAEGIDVQIDYSFDLADFGLGGDAGSVDIFWLGSHRLENSFQPNPGLPPIECAGFFGAPCGITIDGVSDPDWKFTSRFTYRRSSWTASLRWRWTAATTDGRISQAAAFGLPDPTDSIPPDALEYDAQHYFDLSGSWNVLENLRLLAGVDNLFDNDPPTVGTQQVQANTDPSLYDVLGRRFFLSATVSF